MTAYIFILAAKVGKEVKAGIVK